MKWHIELKKQPITFCGHQMFVQEWTGKVREQYERDADKATCLRALIAHISLVDEHGKPIDATVDELSNLPLSELIKVNEAALKVNSITAESVNEAEKN